MANLGIWYDASRIGNTANPNPSNGDDINDLADLSLNGRTASRSGGDGGRPDFTASAAGLNMPALTFAGNQYLTPTSYAQNLNTTPFTLMTVMRTTGGVLLGQPGVQGTYGFHPGPNLTCGIAGSTLAHSNSTYTSNSWAISGFSYANPNGTFYKNGATDGSFSVTAASSTNAWRFSWSGYSTNPYFSGDVAEIVIYERALTTAELEKVNCYYGKKYNLPVTGLVCE